MKKSKYIKLVLLTTTSLVISGCDDPDTLDTPQAYQSVSECMQDVNDFDICDTAEKGAKEDHEENAPKFSNLEQCEKEFGTGKCYSPQKSIPSSGATQPIQLLPIQQPQQQQSIFIPLMQGYFLARMLHDGQPSPSKTYNYTSYYQTPNGNMFSGGCDKRSSDSDCYVGSRTGSSRPVYSSGFVNTWSHSYSSTPSVSRSSSGVSGYKSGVSISKPSSIIRGGFGSSFHSSGGWGG